MVLVRKKRKTLYIEFVVDIRFHLKFVGDICLPENGCLSVYGPGFTVP